MNISQLILSRVYYFISMSICLYFVVSFFLNVIGNVKTFEPKLTLNCYVRMYVFMYVCLYVCNIYIFIIYIFLSFIYLHIFHQKCKFKKIYIIIIAMNRLIRKYKSFLPNLNVAHFKFKFGLTRKKIIQRSCVLF